MFVATSNKTCRLHHHGLADEIRRKLKAAHLVENGFFRYFALDMLQQNSRCTGLLAPLEAASSSRH